MALAKGKRPKPDGSWVEARAEEAVRVRGPERTEMHVGGKRTWSGLGQGCGLQRPQTVPLHPSIRGQL